MDKLVQPLSRLRRRMYLDGTSTPVPEGTLVIIKVQTTGNPARVYSSNDQNAVPSTDGSVTTDALGFVDCWVQRNRNYTLTGWIDNVQVTYTSDVTPNDAYDFPTVDSASSTSTISGVTVGGTPNPGDVLTAIGPNNASWSAPASSSVPDATASVSGVVRLTGDLGGTSVSPVVDRVKGVQLSSTAPVIGQVLTATGPTSAAWSTPASGSGDATLSAKGVVQLSGDLGGTASVPRVLSFNGVVLPTTAPVVGQILSAASGSSLAWTTPSSSVDATASVKGVVQLSGDLGGTADAPVLSRLNGLTIGGSSGTGKSLVSDGSGNVIWTTVLTSVPAPSDATSSTKGVVQLTGDLSGTASSPVVSRLNGVTITGSAAAGQVLTANGSSSASWTTPTTSALATTTSTGTITLSGDLGGTSASPTVLKLGGATIPLSPPSVGQVLTATSSSALSWSTPAAGSGDATTGAKGIVQLSGDIGGTATSVSVVGVRGVQVSATAPTTGQVLTASSASSASWVTPQSVAPTPTATTTTTGTVTLAGDLAGTASAPSVEKIKGVALPSTSPIAGQVLTATSGAAAAWSTPSSAPDATGAVKGIVQLTNDLSGTASSPIVSRILGVALPSTAPVTGQVLTATSSSATAWTTPSSAADATSSVKGIVQLSNDLGGTASAPIVARFSGVNVPSSTPTAGQVLTATSSTTSAWSSPAATSDASTTAKGVVQLTNDLGGTALAPSVEKIKGVSLPSTSPSAGQVLTATSSTSLTWSTPASGPVDATSSVKGVVQLANNLGGTSASPQVVGFYGVSLPSTAPTAGQLLTATSGTAAAWQTFSTPDATASTRGAVQLSGDLTGGTAGSPTVSGIRGVSVSATAPTAGQVLTATSAFASVWATPQTAPDATGSVKGLVQLTNDFGGTSASPSVERLRGVQLPATSPSAGQVLTATSGTASTWATPSSASNATSSSVGLVQLSGDLGGTATAPTVLRLNGVSAPGTAPSNGQVLTATSATSSAWATPTTQDATTSVKGVVQLTSDLGGTATSPSVERIKGITLPAAAPTVGQVLTATSASALSWSTPAAGPVDATAAVNGLVRLSGDLSGSGSSASAPKVSGIQGVQVSATSPSAGQVLTATSGTAASWSTPSTVVDATTSVRGIVQLTSDLGGTATAPSVVGLRGVSLSATAPAAGQVLTASSPTAATWSTPAAGAGDATVSAKGIVQLSGDLSGTGTASATPRVSGIHGIAISSTAPSTGQVLKATSASAASWQTIAEATDASNASKGIVQLTNDLGGTASLPTVEKIKGVTLPATAPTAGQVLTATSGTASAWSTPAAIPGDATTLAKGIVQLSGDLGGTSASPSVLKVNGVTFSGTPSVGNILVATGTTSAAWSAPSSIDASTTAQGVVRLAGDLNGSGTVASSPKVSGIQGVQVSSAAPTAGQVLTATSGTAAQWSTPAAGSGDATASVKGVVQLTGDLAGTGSSAATPKVSGVQGVQVSSTAPSVGQVLTATSASSAQWSTPSAGAGDASTTAKGIVQLSGDLSGAAATPSVVGIRGVAVSATAPTANQVLMATSTTTAAWSTLAGAVDATASVKGQVQLAGDLAGTGSAASTPRVSGIQGVSISSTAPTAGQAIVASSPSAASWTTVVAGTVIDSLSSTSASDPLSANMGKNLGDRLALLEDPTTVTISSNVTITSANRSSYDNKVWKFNDGSFVVTIDPGMKIEAVGLPPATGSANIAFGAGVTGNGASSTISRTQATHGLIFSVVHTQTDSYVVTGDASSGSTVDATTTVKGIVQLAGDIGGTATAVTVEKVKGVTISATAPTAGQVLTATSGTAAQWSTPAAGSGDATTLAKGVVQLAGDLAGTGTDAATPRVSGIQGVQVSSTAPTAGQILAATSGTAASWSTPTVAAAGTFGVVRLNGDLAGAGGSGGSPRVSGIQSVQVSSTAPTAGQVLTATSGTAAQWSTPSTGDATTSVKGVVQLAGDIGGTATSVTVEKLKGVSLPASAPVAGQVLLSTSGTALSWDTLVKDYVSVSSSRDLNSTDDGKVLVCSSALTLTIPAGLTFKQGCAVVPPSSGAVTVTAASGVSANGSVASTTTRTLADNAAGFGIMYLGTTDFWGVSGSSGPASVVDATTTVKGVVQLAGDIGGTASSVSVEKVRGISVSATAPTAGQVLTATSGTAAQWSSVPSSSSSASGVVDLTDLQALGAGRKILDLNVRIGNGPIGVTNRANLLGIGSGSLGSATNTADQVVAIGFNSLTALTDATEVTSVGHGAGLAVTTGSRNSFFGTLAGSKTTTGSDVLAIGYGAMGGTASATTSKITVIGSQVAGNATGSEFTAVGFQAAGGYQGNFGTFMGNLAGSAATGNHVVSIGNASGRSAGNFVVAVGSQAAETTANTFTNVTVVGHVCGQHVRGNQTSFFGRSAGQYVTANQNSGFGTFALQMTDTTVSSALGYAAGRYGMGNSSTYLGAGSGPSKGASVGTGVVVTVTATGTLSFSPALSASSGKVVVTAVTAGTWTDIGVTEEFPVTLTSSTTGTTNSGLASAGKIGLNIASADVNSLSSFNNITCVGAGANALAANQVALGNSSVTSILLAGNLAIDIGSIAGAADGTPIVKRTVSTRPTITV